VLQEGVDAAQVVVGGYGGAACGIAMRWRVHPSRTDQPQALQCAIATDELTNSSAGCRQSSGGRIAPACRREVDPVRHLHRLVDVVTDEQDGLAQSLLHAQNSSGWPRG
jgi:hypothetical protein